MAVKSCIINEDTPRTIDDIINEKVDLLYDFCILLGRHDHREKAVRTMLKECGTEYRMTIKLHDILRGRRTLNQVLKEGGLI